MDEYMDSYRKQREGEAKAYEENIDDHKHKWNWLEEPDYVNTFEYKVHCGDISDHGKCDAVLTWDEVLRCLNALKEIKKVILYPTEAHDRTSADSG